MKGSLDYIPTIEPLKDIFLPAMMTNTSWSTCGFLIKLERKQTKYVIENILPAAIFVTTSWISFLIPPSVIPGRLALLITLFLVLTNLLISASRQVPNSEKVTVLVNWILSCLVFVLGATYCYAWILYLQRKSSKKVGPDAKPPKDVDRIMLFAFPSAFILYNIVFWPYMTWNKAEKPNLGSSWMEY